MQTTQAYQTINRGWLKKQIAQGKMEAKCDYHLTDDYAYDNDNKGGRTTWMPVRIRQAVYAHSAEGSRFDRLVDDDFRAGCINLDTWHFTGKSGRAWRQADGNIALIVHSNLSYTLREKQAQPIAPLAPASLSKPRVRIMAVAVEA